MGRLTAVLLFFVFVLVGTAMLAGLALSSRDYEVAATVPRGDGPGQLVAESGGGEQAPICPLGVEAADAGRVLITDIDAKKIVRLDLRTNTYRENGLAIEPALRVEGLIYEADQIFLWTEETEAQTGFVSPLRLGEDGVYSIVEEGAGFQDGETSEPTADAIGRFADLGFEPPDDGGFLASPLRRPSVRRVVLESWRETVALEAGELIAQFDRNDQGELTFRITNPEGRAFSGLYVLEGDLVSARLYRRPVSGNAPIIISESRTSQDGRLSFASTVLMVDISTGAVEVYRVPTLDGALCQPKQNLTISEAGDIYTLAALPDGVRVLRLRPNTPLLAARFALERAYAQVTQEQRPPPAATAPAVAPPAATPSAAPEQNEEPAPAPMPSSPGAAPATPMGPYVAVPRGAEIARSDVVRNACLFMSHPWTLSPQNYTLTGRTEAWRRPARLNDRVGAMLLGLPYAWGGNDSLDHFDRKIALGRPAGDVCTPKCGGNVVRDEQGVINSVFTAGVDCSGFVMRALGWRGARHTTSSLAAISTVIALDELRPGDVLNDAGSHVRMFLSWRGDSVIEFAESSVWCGGVCRRKLHVSQFQDYTPLRLNHVARSGAELTPADIDALCPHPYQTRSGAAGGG